MLKQSLAVMGREVNYLWRDKGLRYILLVTTLLSLLLFYFIYSAQVIKDIPTVVVDLDQTSASRDVISKLTEAENLKVVDYPNSFQQMQQLIKQGQAQVGVVIPEGYGQDVALHRQTKLYCTIDASNIVYATNANNALLTVSRTISAQAGVKTLLAKGVQYNQALEAYQGISFQEEPWFNPTVNYAYFLVLAMALNIWQQCCTMTACTTIISETGRGSWQQIKATGFSKATLFVSKALVHIVTFMLMVIPVYLLAFWVLKFPLDQNFGLLLLFTLAFAISVHSVGTLASSIAKNAVDATRLGMIVALPSFLVSGYTWPLEQMPTVIQVLAKSVPQTWFFQGFNYLAFKDPSCWVMVKHFGVLGLIACLCYSAAAVIVWRKS